MIPNRGDVWRIRFDPAEGDEIKKIRTAVVVSGNAIGKLLWFIRLVPTPTNGLTKESGADTFQVKSVSETRFLDKLGALTTADLDKIAKAVALCVGVP